MNEEVRAEMISLVDQIEDKKDAAGLIRAETRVLTRQLDRLVRRNPEIAKELNVGQEPDEEPAAEAAAAPVKNGKKPAATTAS